VTQNTRVQKILINRGQLIFKLFVQILNNGFVTFHGRTLLVGTGTSLPCNQDIFTNRGLTVVRAAQA
jgi:hypothetical protein